MTIIDAHGHVGRWEHADFLGSASLDESLAVVAELPVTGCAIMPTDRSDNAGLLAEAVAAAGRTSLRFFARMRQVALGEPGRGDLRRRIFGENGCAFFGEPPK